MGNERSKDSELYLKAWRMNMVQIWQDRLDLLGVHDTGALRQSVKAGELNLRDAEADMALLC